MRTFDRDLQQVHFRRDVAAHEADEEEAAVFLQAVEVLREVAAANEVEDAVRAAVRLGDGGEVVGFVVDGGRTVVFDDAHFFGVADGGEGADAERSCDGERGEADAAGAAMYQQGFAGAHLAVHEKVCQTVKAVSGSIAASCRL